MPQHDFGDFAAAEPDIIHEEQVPSDMEGSHADILAVDHEDGWVQVGDHHWYIDLTNDWMAYFSQGSSRIDIRYMDVHYWKLSFVRSRRNTMVRKNKV